MFVYKENVETINRAVRYKHSEHHHSEHHTGHRGRPRMACPLASLPEDVLCAVLGALLPTLSGDPHRSDLYRGAVDRDLSLEILATERGDRSNRACWHAWRSVASLLLWTSPPLRRRVLGRAFKSTNHAFPYLGSSSPLDAWLRLRLTANPSLLWQLGRGSQSANSAGSTNRTARTSVILQDDVNDIDLNSVRFREARGCAAMHWQDAALSRSLRLPSRRRWADVLLAILCVFGPTSARTTTTHSETESEIETEMPSLDEEATISGESGCALARRRRLGRQRCKECDVSHLLCGCVLCGCGELTLIRAPVRASRTRVDPAAILCSVVAQGCTRCELRVPVGLCSRCKRGPGRSALSDGGVCSNCSGFFCGECSRDYQPRPRVSPSRSNPADR
jgi:hypothetical protein